MAQLDFVLNQFHSDIQRARDLLQLVKEFRQFAGSSVPEELKNGTILWPEAVELADAAPRVRTDLPILSGSILLYICSRFEYFVRELVIALADDIANRASAYEELPPKIREELMARTLDIAQNPHRFGYSRLEVEQLLVTLTTSIDSSRSSTPLTISSRVLTITESNMNSRTMTEILKRVNFVDLWSDVGKQATLKAHLSTSDDRECTKEAMSKLDALMKERNGIAHPTGTGSFPDPDQVAEAATFLELLSQILVDLAKVPRP